MPNVIKYSTTIQPNTIKKGNVILGVNNIGYGPSNVTGYWAGIDPPTSGYTIYRVATETSGYTINTCETDSDVIYWASIFGNTGGDNINQALQYLTTGNTNTTIVNKNYENIVTSGLVLNLDATFVPSYPNSGTLWYDISGNVNNGTLTNGPTYSSLSGGSIVFDGGNDFVSLPNGVLSGTGDFTVNQVIKCNGGIGGTTFGNYNNGNLQVFFGTNYIGLFLANSSTYLGVSPWNIQLPQYTTSPVMITASRSGTTTYFHINGVLQKSGSSSSTIGTVSSQFRLGTNTGTGEAYNGSIYSTQVYSRALSLTEIQQNYEVFGKSFVSFEIQYLVVAGGGAGGAGSYPSGGGGAGGLLTGYSISLTTNTSYSITVGAGGSSSNGSNSKFNTDTAIGGGRGGNGNSGAGSSGGSGGGGATNYPTTVAWNGYLTPAGSGTVGQGNNGGVGKSIYFDNRLSGIPTGAGGGGGAGAIGNTGTTTPFSKAGDGGAGLYFSEYTSIGGSPVGWFAGGGGGSTSFNNGGVNGIGLGGNGGGGKGSYTSFSSGPSATAGTANTGGGGGGTGYQEFTGVNGGSGVVILRIPSAYVANFSVGVSATMTWVGSYKYYRVTATSTTSETVTFS